MGKSSAIIFDVDGTLIDNNPFHRKAWTIFLAKHKISLDNFDYKKLFGKHNKEILKTVFNRDLNDEELVKYAHEKESIYRDIYRAHIKPIEGLIELLETIKQKGIKMGVATSAPPENLEFVLSELKIKFYFSALIDATYVKQSKPNPEIFLLTAKKINVKPQECLVFEDSPSGILGAVNAGMKVIGVNVVDQNIAKKHCEDVIEHFEQLHNKIHNYI